MGIRKISFFNFSDHNGSVHFGSFWIFQYFRVFVWGEGGGGLAISNLFGVLNNQTNPNLIRTQIVHWFYRYLNYGFKPTRIQKEPTQAWTKKIPSYVQNVWTQNKMICTYPKTRCSDLFSFTNFCVYFKNVIFAELMRLKSYLTYFWLS